MRLDQPSLRTLRAGCFAVVCVSISAGLHVFAGGAIADWGTVGAALAGVGLLGYLLAGRQRSLGQIMTAAFAIQYGLHHVFGLERLLTHEPTQLAGTTHHGGDTGVSMLLVHVLTALISAWWLERGESYLAELLTLLATHVAARLGVAWFLRPLAPPVVTPLLQRPEHDAPRPIESPFRRVVTLRGPPLPR